MKFADLPETAIEKIKATRWDRTLEKHEGPASWKSVLRYHEVELLEKVVTVFGGLIDFRSLSYFGETPTNPKIWQRS